MEEYYGNCNVHKRLSRFLFIFRKERKLSFLYSHLRMLIVLNAKSLFPHTYTCTCLCSILSYEKSFFKVFTSWFWQKGRKWILKVGIFFGNIKRIYYFLTLSVGYKRKRQLEVRHQRTLCLDIFCEHPISSTSIR